MRMSTRTRSILWLSIDDKGPFRYVEASAAAWAAVENGAGEGPLAAHAVTTIHYLLQRELGPGKATCTISAILRVFGVAPVDGGVVQAALPLLSCK